MRNEKADRRKKKLAERHRRSEELSKRHREQEVQRPLRSVPLQPGGGYPDFELHPLNGDPAFVELVTAALQQFRFDELPPHEHEVYKLVKSHGAGYAARALRAAMEEIQKEGGERGESARFGELAWHFNLGQAVLDKIPRDRLLAFIPQNNVRFVPTGNRIVVAFDTMLREPGAQGTVWYSRRRPVIEVGGTPYVVAFSKHAMERTCERLKRDWTTYAALGDVFAFLNHCVYYERATLHPDQLAFTFYNLCDDPQFTTYWYVLDVLGKENLDPAKGKPYYRIGYCPAVIEGGFLKAKTLLFPGYTSTPEFGAILRSSLPRAEKEALIDRVTRLDTGVLYDGGDVTVMRWFHENGVLQVIQTSRTMYRYD